MIGVLASLYQYLNISICIVETLSITHLKSPFNYVQSQTLTLFVVCACYLFIYFGGLHWVFFAVRALFSICSERGLLFAVVRGLLIAVASIVAKHGL